MAVAFHLPNLNLPWSQHHHHHNPKPKPHIPITNNPHNPKPHNPVPHDPIPHNPVPHNPVPHKPIPHDPKEPPSHHHHHPVPQKPLPTNPPPANTTPPKPQNPEEPHEPGLQQQQTDSGSPWTLQDTFQGKSFFDGFAFFSKPDPTHGFVKYVDQQTAEATGLVQFQDNAVIMKADNHTIAPDGRSSVRISSHNTYEYGLFLFDIEHMPIGCAQWPAVWLLGPDWPNGGEIDIVEGINTQTRNLMTLHTSEGCTQKPHSNQTGNTVTDNCDVNAPDQGQNQGCTVEDSSRESFGYRFNKQRGGVFAVQWLPASGIQIWFFDRGEIPADIQKGQPNPQTWKIPSADFPFDGVHCSQKFFNKLNIVINLTFCGDWAGNADLYHKASCPGDCATFVKNNPNRFSEAYWRIRGIKVYTLNK
ncbi:concanavalin A-like lectin/glucanase domain-containing protein [Fennellomyces sp. T-0311]|nr:concanavalin A-like lectin/glucanase domain-containing protein [Fennellomyces sp. T-0311]